MAVNTSSATSAVPVRREVLVLLLCLLPVLGILFHRSFRPEEVLFSNDGPLGAVAAQAGHAWDNLRGVWQDLNWLGSRQPAGFLAIGYAIFACLGPLLYSKFIAPISLLVLGLGAWLFFRQLRFSPLACVLGTQIKGIVGMEQDKQTKERRWDEATSASLRKVEALRIIIPGLFGYRMPELYGEPVESANGSNYWGAMGQSPVTLRHSGGGE